MHRQQVDTNVLQVKMACPKEANIEIATGDPYFCTQCKSVFNNLSTFEEAKETTKWTCEFCNTANDLDIDEEEIPKSAAINYIMQAAAKVHS